MVYRIVFASNYFQTPNNPSYYFSNVFEMVIRQKKKNS